MGDQSGRDSMGTMSFQIGDTVGDYKITGVVGSGGMGQVFKVKHTVTGRVEAMKVLAGYGEDDGEGAHRSLREIQVQAKLHHPNIVSVHNAFRRNDHLVMVMEFVEGDSLETVIKVGPIPLPVGLDYIDQALRGLSYAHAHDVVHRDIKPANLLLTPDETVKLTDFGLAKNIKDHSLTQTGAVIGSLYYISPEQVQGARTLDSRADLYSLGALLYEVATGRKPFDSDKSYSLMVAHVTQQPEPPCKIVPTLPPLLSEVILTALEKNPDERFQSADEFRDAVVRVMRILGDSPTEDSRARAEHSGGHLRAEAAVERPSSSEPLERSSAAKAPREAQEITQELRPDRPAESSETRPADSFAATALKTARPGLSHRRTVPALLRSPAVVLALSGAAAGVLLTLIFGGPQQTFSGGSPDQDLVQLEEDPQKGSPSPGLKARGGNAASEPTEPVQRKPDSAEPSQQKPAGGQSSEGVEPSSLAKHEEVKPSPVRLHSRQRSEEADSEPSNPYRLVRSLNSGTGVWALTFSPDGRWVSAATDNNTVKIWRVASGEEAATLRGHKARVVALSFSPDGRYLASGSWDGTAKLWDVSGRRLVRSLRHKKSVSSVAFSPDGRLLACGSSDKTIRVWDLQTGTVLRQLRGHKREMQALAFSPGGDFLASVSAEKTVRLWPLETGDRYELRGPELGATAVTFSADGRRLAVAGGDRVKVWDVQTRRETQVKDAPGWLHALAPTPDGSFLALGATPEGVRLWDVGKAGAVSSFTGDEAIRSMAVSPGGNRLATATEEGTIRIWETKR